MKNLVLLLCLVFLGTGVMMAQNKFIGAEKCKMCHNKADKGEQYNKWKGESHSKAHLAKDVAGKPECEKCHAPVKEFKTEGVTCEACHGAGEKYKAPNVMKDQALSIKNGLIVPDEKLCKSCHDAAKAPKGHGEIKFDYTAGSAKIKHWK